MRKNSASSSFHLELIHRPGQPAVPTAKGYMASYRCRRKARLKALRVRCVASQGLQWFQGFQPRL